MLSKYSLASSVFFKINHSAMTFSFTTDINTGIYSSGADTLNFVTAGSERMRISSTGNVGIGTTSPYAKLSVVGETVSSYFTATSTTATSTFAGGLNVENGGLIYDYSTNNVGIGTTSPYTKLSVTGNTSVTGTTLGTSHASFGANAQINAPDFYYLPWA